MSRAAQSAILVDWCADGHPQAQQLESSDTAQMVMGVMIESNLVEGRQDIPPSGPQALKYGQSVTGAHRFVFFLSPQNRECSPR